MIPSDVESINPDQHIVSLNTKKASLNLTFVLREILDIDHLKIKIKMVWIFQQFFGFFVFTNRSSESSIEDVRVGQELNYDKLILEVWTNGSITTELAVKQVSSILMDRLIIIWRIKS